MEGVVMRQSQGLAVSVLRHGLLGRAAVGVLTLGLGWGAAGCSRPPAMQGGPPDDPEVRAVIARAETRAVGEIVDLVGEVVARESVDLIGEVDARLEAVGFEEGAAVEAEQLLFRFDDARLQARLAQARASHRLAETNLRRGADLLKNETISQQEFDQTEAAFQAAAATLAVAEEDLADARMVAPFAGVITRRRVSPGQFVRRGEALASLVQMDPLEVVFHVPERHLGKVRPGQSVRFRSAGAAMEFEAEVTYLAPRLDPATRTLEVKARLENPEARLRPGMFGRVRMVVDVREDAVVVPAAAVAMSPQGTRVVVMNDEGRSEFRMVEPGRRVDGLIEIRSGVEAGERVVVEGHQKMGPGMRIVVSPRSEAYGIEPEADTAGEGA